MSVARSGMTLFEQVAALAMPAHLRKAGPL